MSGRTLDFIHNRTFHTAERRPAHIPTGRPLVSSTFKRIDELPNDALLNSIVGARAAE